MSSRFDYVKFDEVSSMVQGQFKETVLELEEMVEKVLVDSREKLLALEKLEEAFMWIGKAIKSAQENRPQEKLGD